MNRSLLSSTFFLLLLSSFSVGSGQPCQDPTSLEIFTATASFAEQGPLDSVCQDLEVLVRPVGGDLLAGQAGASRWLLYHNGFCYGHEDVRAAENETEIRTTMARPVGTQLMSVQCERDLDGELTYGGCVSVQVEVSNNQPPVSLAMVGNAEATVCPGEGFSLEASGHQSAIAPANFSLAWFDASAEGGECSALVGGEVFGYGDVLDLPQGVLVDTNFSARILNDCPLSESDCNSITVHVHSTSQPPTSISLLSGETCEGQQVTLQLEGGHLGAPDSEWEWRKGSCGGPIVVRGRSDAAIFLLEVGDEFYVRAKDSQCGRTACTATQLNVRANSRAPQRIVRRSFEGCGLRLEVEGGSLGSDAAWRWYKGGCGEENGGTPLLSSEANDTTLVTEGVEGKYFVRAEGGEEGCGPTACVMYEENPLAQDEEAPTSIQGGSYRKVCLADYYEGTQEEEERAQVVLRAVGGEIGNQGATWSWYRGGCGDEAGEGETNMEEEEGDGGAVVDGRELLLEGPSVRLGEESYFVRVERGGAGVCRTECASQTLFVSSAAPASTAPEGVVAFRSVGDGGQYVLLRVLQEEVAEEEGEEEEEELELLVWYRDGCGEENGGQKAAEFRMHGNQLAEGEEDTEVIMEVKDTTAFFVRRENGCGASQCKVVDLEEADFDGYDDSDLFSDSRNEEPNDEASSGFRLVSSFFC
ncbi:hypothetical protein QOT17_022488 [Balamuthia mandrillaris]